MAVTVWLPTSFAVQVSPSHDPFGVIASVALLSGPRLLPLLSLPVTAYFCEAPGATVDVTGDSVREATGSTFSVAWTLTASSSSSYGVAPDIGMRCR